MHRRSAPWILTLLFLSGCAGQPGAPVTAEQVSVHESVASAPPSFKVIKRYWVDSWATAFLLPTYASEDDARQAFKTYAADAGGNGVINFGCYRMYDETSLRCNGTVVRFQ